MNMRQKFRAWRAKNEARIQEEKMLAPRETRMIDVVIIYGMGSLAVLAVAILLLEFIGVVPEEVGGRVLGLTSGIVLGAWGVAIYSLDRRVKEERAREAVAGGVSQ